MRWPLVATMSVPEWNWVTRVLLEESSKVTKYGDRVQLIGMIRCIKDSFSSRNSISDNDNMCSVLHLNCSINPTPNGKEFCFSRHYIHCMINSFCDNVLTSVNVRDQCSDIGFDTSIQNDENYVLVNEGILVNIIKFDIIQKLGESSLFKLSKVGNTLFKLVSTIELLIFNCYLAVKWDMDHVVRFGLLGMMFVQEKIDHMLFGKTHVSLLLIWVPIISINTTS